MNFPEPDTVQKYRVFLSSSDEADTRRLRERVQRLIYDVINPRLDEYEEAGVSLSLQRWEQEAAQRVAPGQVNQLFTAKARRAALTIVLLLDEIRRGTREEFEAAIGEADRQVSVLVFDRTEGSDRAKARELDEYLAPYKDQILLNDRCGVPDGDDAWIALVNTLLAFTFRAMRENDERATGDRSIEVRN